jgi:hypothetical protein
MDKPQAHKLKLPLLILVIVLVLGGGGFAIWMATKKEEEEETIVAAPQEGAKLPPVSGRTDVTNLYTEDELAFSGLVNEELPDKTPEYSVVLMDSKEGKTLIEDRVRKIQLNKKDSDFIRAKHQVGRTLVKNKIFSTKANVLIEKMFGFVDGVTAGNYLTYPVYGKYETEAAPLRADIDSFLSKDGQGYNLTNLRHGGNRWWFGSVGLNLMYGNKNAHFHSADKIWWYKASRSGLDFFKEVNGHNFSDRKLVDTKKNGKGVFAAWNMYNFVKEWKSAMDFFDKVTRDEAITALEREGSIKRF